MATHTIPIMATGSRRQKTFHCEYKKEKGGVSPYLSPQLQIKPKPQPPQWILKVTKIGLATK
jgi:hypothetical protein